MSRRKIAVCTDSTAFLPTQLLEKYEINVIPLILHWDDETLKDNVDITPQRFYERLQSARTIPTTSQPSVGQFKEFFEAALADADGIVGVFISSELSGTVASAQAASNFLSEASIEIVDSRSASMGLGLIALAAARAAHEGESLQEVAEAARRIVPHMRVMFVVDTLEFLHRGGRIGGARRFVGSMLSIKPLLHLSEGRIEPLVSVRTKKKAVERMLRIAEEEVASAHGVSAAVIHAGAEEEAHRIFQEFKERVGPEEFYLTELSPVIGTHAGPGTVGLGYYVAP